MEKETDRAKATDCLERVKGGTEKDLFISKLMSDSCSQSGLIRERD